jgi:phosphatidylserine/phosphatidylglycerophosphate/cardiolipin synthase-like enzyme
MKYFVDYLPITAGNDTRLYLDGESYCLDLYAELRAAKRFVLLTGLHFMPKFRLVRTGGQIDASSTLVKVLAELGERGVEVFLVVNQFWKDESEIQLKEKFFKGQIAKAGELHGYLPETYALFQALRGHKNIHCRTDLHPHPIFGTHHQKTVVIDDKVAFLGGIDLTFLDGDRWDTHAHVAKHRAVDRTQKFWHDVHMRLQGPAVQFVRDNFIQRWVHGDLYTLREKQPSDDPLEAVNLHFLGDPLIIEPVPGRVPPPLPRFTYTVASKLRYPTGKETPDEPQVQIVRSMPWARGVFKVAKPIWHKGKDRWDHSCKDAYLIGLRLARKYIYLENQWVADEDIWEELAAAARRNQSNPEFRIVVMVPYEGLFAAGLGSNQELWIDAEIGKVIDASQSHATFGMYALEQTSHTGSALDAQIYVHSKILIVDDEWALIGSANAGGISLEGARSGRDQPDSELSAIILDRAFASDFRKRVWKEHLGLSVKASYDVHDADEFRRLAAKAPRHKVRFYPVYAELYNPTLTSAIWVRKHYKPLSLASFKKQSRIIPSFPGRLVDGLPPTLITAAFRAYVVPAVPAGHRAWYRWSCELLGPATSSGSGKPFQTYRLRSAKYDTDSVFEYSDQDTAYIGKRTAEAIDREITDIMPGRIKCRIQIIPLYEGPDDSNQKFDNMLLTWECTFMNGEFAKNNHPDFVVYRPVLSVKAL